MGQARCWAGGFWVLCRQASMVRVSGQAVRPRRRPASCRERRHAGEVRGPAAPLPTRPPPPHPELEAGAPGHAHCSQPFADQGISWKALNKSECTANKDKGLRGRFVLLQSFFRPSHRASLRHRAPGSASRCERSRRLRPRLGKDSVKIPLGVLGSVASSQLAPKSARQKAGGVRPKSSLPPRC